MRHRLLSGGPAEDNTVDERGLLVGITGWQRMEKIMTSISMCGDYSRKTEHGGSAWIDPAGCLASEVDSV